MGERALLAVLFVWLALLPLPFGSVIDEARTALIAVPLALCCVAALLRLYATRDRTNTAQPTRPWLIWGNGALLFSAFVALQLVPLPRAIVEAVSPDSAAIWNAASQLVTLAGETPRAFLPVSVDPRATLLELFRLVALVATFITAALLVRTHARRSTLAMFLCLAALFEVGYGVREAALQRYAIWGWVNKLVFDRVTGTFVNPNHFAHYLAIVLPMALFLAAALWHRAGDREMRLGQRFVILIENSAFAFGFAVITAIACAAGILLSQSRGALLSLATGLMFVAALLPGRRVARVAFASTAGIVIVIALALILGPQRTVQRFAGTGTAFEGRRIGTVSALAVWQRFSIAGSGAQTFDKVVSMEQRGDHDKIYSHAHNDYAEIAATTGAIGFTIAMVTLIGGYGALVRMTFGAHAHELTWSRRAFQVAALASLTIAMAHALIDFNFFIPSNPATLAAILGASAASLDHDKRTRR
jgi:O-Antigen ligase